MKLVLTNERNQETTTVYLQEEDVAQFQGNMEFTYDKDNNPIFVNIRDITIPVRTLHNDGNGLKINRPDPDQGTGAAGNPNPDPNPNPAGDGGQETQQQQTEQQTQQTE